MPHTFQTIAISGGGEIRPIDTAIMAACYLRLRGHRSSLDRGDSQVMAGF